LDDGRPGLRLDLKVRTGSRPCERWKLTIQLGKASLARGPPGFFASPPDPFLAAARVVCPSKAAAGVGGCGCLP